MNIIKQPNCIKFGIDAAKDFKYPDKSLVVTSKGAISRGWLDYTNLENQMYYDDVEPNPSLDTAEKQKLIETHQIHPTDTGSAEVQVAMLSKRISKLSDHLQGNIHDFASRQGLLKMIGKRKRLLSFIKDKNLQRYQELVKKIGIRG